LGVYRQQTGPVIEYYTKKGILQVMDGKGHPDDIFLKLLKTL